MEFGNNSDAKGPWDMAEKPEEHDYDDFDGLNAQERATNPDMAFAAEIARQRAEEFEAERAELQSLIDDPNTYLRRREVRLRIMQADGLLEDEIKRGSSSNNQGCDTHMEFNREWSNIVYVYHTKDFKEPFYQLPKKLDSNRSKVPLAHRGATVLLRVDCWNEAVTEIHRWEDDDE